MSSLGRKFTLKRGDTTKDKGKGPASTSENQSIASGSSSSPISPTSGRKPKYVFIVSRALGPQRVQCTRSVKLTFLFLVPLPHQTNLTNCALWILLELYYIYASFVFVPGDGDVRAIGSGNCERVFLAWLWTATTTPLGLTGHGSEYKLRYQHRFNPHAIQLNVSWEHTWSLICILVSLNVLVL